MPRLARSYLYTPGDRPELFDKAARSRSDAVVLDLEDGVGHSARQSARAAVSSFVNDATAGVQWWIRVDPAHLEEDIEATVRRGVSGVFLPKSDVDLLFELDELLNHAEDRSGIERGSTAVVGLVETAAAISRVSQVAEAPRLLRLGIGEADLAADLSIIPGPERQEMWPIRSAVVVASAAAGIESPVGPAETILGDTEVLRASTELLLRQGFRARTAIHPSQLHVIRNVFTPTAEQIAAAREVLDVLARASNEGTAVGVTDSGQFVDAAVARSARSVIDRAADLDSD